MSLPNDRKMIEYYPEFLRKHFAKLIFAEEPEIELAWSNLKDVLANAHLYTAKELGVKRLEKILEITPKSEDSLEDRKFAVQAALMDNQIITTRALEEQLQILCGDGGYSMQLEHTDYILRVQLNLGVKSQFEVVRNLLETRLPANLLIYITLKYNTHTQLKEFTHAQLEAFTHEQIRSEVLS